MSEPATGDSNEPPANRATREATLADGMVLTVALSAVPDRFDADALVGRALEGAARELALALAAGGSEPEPATSYEGIVGRSAPMRALFRMLERLRGSNATVLITGENGTGKELVARAIHRQSPRANRRFVAANCSAFNDNLLESELFGHKRGAFTGAVSDKPGLFEVADGGTFFLDEVGDMSPGMQVKLLRVLQEGVFFPVGATEPRKVDVRIIAATNRDLPTLVAQGSFREDLYYRLHVVALRVPSLRERREDIPLLVDHFLAQQRERTGRTKLLSRRALERLLAHDWPGNVRELENEIERMWVLSGDETLLDEELLSPAVRDAGSRPPSTAPAALPAEAGASEPVAAGVPLAEALASYERRLITAAVQRAGGNLDRAADELRIGRRQLVRRIRELGVPMPVVDEGRTSGQ
ncbi:MAG: sigma-54 dependent transcriptional regulator [Myxococcota bacterium]|nr:sigma-54 dependent transcriptional regulator [Myxococcota bacterium]MDW8363913.1 sigma-54 dependent transcriptional regulator [Myxococcales bacterium]